MIKRINKITSLMVAAAAVASIIPATGVNAADMLKTQDGTIEKAVAFEGGNYIYEGYKTDNNDQAVYFNNGKEDKALENVNSADIKGEYSDKYAYALDGKDQYLVDLSNGNVSDSVTPGDNADTAATKLRTAIKKTDRYGAVTVDSSDLGYDEANDKTGALPGDKFEETWYQYGITPVSTQSKTEANLVDGKLYGFTNGDGKYIDASSLANIYAYSTAKGKEVKIEKFSNSAEDVDDSTQLLATLVKAPQVLTQDKDYIYAMVTVNITDTDANAVIAGTTTSAQAVVDGAKVTTHTYIQKISKAQGDQVDGAYLPKNVESYELLSADDKLDNSDSKDARTAIENALANGEVSVVGNQLLAIEINSADSNVKVTSIDFKKDKIKYVDGFTQANLGTSKVDVYLAEKNDSDDIDADNASKAYDVDVNGNVWVVADGKISKFADNKFGDVYKVDSSLNELNVYDENNMIAWKENGNIFTTVGGTKTTEDTTGKTDTTGTTQTPVVAKGWVQAADGTWAYNKEDGTKATGWIQDGSAWYFLKANGAMATGWVQDGSTWYFLNGSGAMKTGWIKDNGTWYFLNGSGAMKTGWINDNGTWYFLNGSGSMQTGWINDNGTWYYCNASGAMLANTTVDGYKLNTSGAWVK